MGINPHCQVAPMVSCFAPMTQSSACTRDTPVLPVEGEPTWYLVPLASQILPFLPLPFCPFYFFIFRLPFFPF